MLRRDLFAFSLYAVAFLSPGVAAAQGVDARHSDSTRVTARPADSAQVHERAIKRERNGAGLRLGSWQVSGPAGAASSGTSSLPAFEGYWQKGIDRHVVIETSAGLWTRQQRATSPGGASSGAYVIPMLTSIKVYPGTNPGATLEPFTMAGVGFTIGVDDQNAGSSGGLVGGSGGGTNLVPGFGLKAGAGIEYHLGSAFGVQMQAGYQFVRFFQDVGADRTYKGMQIFGGLTYRLQF